MSKKLILIALNEINFDVVREYCKHSQGNFPGFEKLMQLHTIETFGEDSYDELEPWIQWVSVHTGLAFEQHRVFRLGDITESKAEQVFERLERNGCRVGCVAPMNAENRLKAPAYFIPDPWTNTRSDGSWWSKKIAGAISQAVNDNATSRISTLNLIYLLLTVARFARITHYPKYIWLALSSRERPWRKALFLDLLLHDLHLNLFNNNKVEFSSIFLNGGAHIQHHYFFNATPIKIAHEQTNPEWYVSSKEDPVREMLNFYNELMTEILTLKNVEVLVATGLSQVPYDRAKFYYRLKRHENFFKLLGIRFKSIIPRMTRDFLVLFDSDNEAKVAANQLSSIMVAENEESLFGEIEERSKSLFVTLTYPRQITECTEIFFEDKKYNLLPHVAFVAIKNGMHQSKGFAFFTQGLEKFAPPNRSHVKELYCTLINYYS